MIISNDPNEVSSQVLTENCRNVFLGKCFMLYCVAEEGEMGVPDDVFESLADQSVANIGIQ